MIIQVEAMRLTTWEAAWPVDVIVGEVLSENSPKMLLVENDHVVETLATDRANQSLGLGILPRGMWRGEDLLDPHSVDPRDELVAVDCISISQKILRRFIERKGLDDLLRRPSRAGVVGDVEVDDLTAFV